MLCVAGCWLLDCVVFMSIRILSWNVRGLNNPKKRSVIKNILWDWKCDVVCLQETKCSAIDLSVI
jgi:exonuclease III